jgi:uncharacterized protein YxeA
MKKIMSLMLGMTLVFGAASMFAQADKKTDDTTKTAKKGRKGKKAKKTDTTATPTPAKP